MKELLKEIFKTAPMPKNCYQWTVPVSTHSIGENVKIPYDDVLDFMWFDHKGKVYTISHNKADFSGKELFQKVNNTVHKIKIIKQQYIQPVLFITSGSNNSPCISPNHIYMVEWVFEIIKDTGYSSMKDLQKYENCVVPKFCSFTNLPLIKDEPLDDITIPLDGINNCLSTNQRVLINKLNGVIIDFE